MGNLRCCLLAQWIVVGICFLLILVQHFQLSLMRKSQTIAVPVSRQNQTTGETLTNDRSTFVEDDQTLPGPYNLLEDADIYSSALIRPTKECTLGKIYFFLKRVPFHFLFKKDVRD